MLLRRIAGTFILALTCAQLAFPVSYYVDNSCPNNGDGTAQTCAASPGAAGPFNSIANVQSAITGDQHGNSVLLKAGETFREQYTVPAYGTSAGQFTIGSYGSVAMPVVNASDLLTSWTQATTVTGSVTQANMRLSLINGSAFADFSVANTLTPYIGAQLTVTDTSGTQSAVGYIKAAGTSCGVTSPTCDPAGESLGSELLPNPAMDNLADFGFINSAGVILTTGCQSGNCLQVTSSSTGGSAVQTFSASIGALLRNTVYAQKGTEATQMQFLVSNWEGFFPIVASYFLPSVWTQYVNYATAPVAGMAHQYVVKTSTKTGSFDTSSARQVLTPSPTGATIVSTALGSTRNWSSIGGSFNYNDTSYTYSIPFSSSVYYHSYSTVPNQVFEDGVWLARNTVSPASLTAGQWFLDTASSRIWVYLRDGDAPSNGHTLEASQRDYGIYGTALSYVTINGLKVQQANLHNIYFNASNNVIVENSNSFGAYYCGIEANSVTTGNNGWLVTGNTVSWNGGTGILWAGVGSGMTVSHNSTFNNAWGGSWTSDGNFAAQNGIRFIGLGSSSGVMANGTIEYNISYNNGLGPEGTWNTEGVEDGGGLMLDTVGSGNVMRYNISYNNEVANLRVTVDLYGSKVYGNVSFANTNQTLPDYGNGIQVFYGLSGTEVYANTSYGNIVGLTIAGVYPVVPNSVLNVVAKNNISTGNTLNFQAEFGGENDGTYGSGNVYTYNDFGTQASNFIKWGAGNLYGTYAAWEAATGNCGTTGCSHSIQTNPTFANAGAGQFWQTVGSSGIASGTPLGDPYNIGIQPGSSWPYNVFLVPNFNNDLGAFPYTGSVIDSVTGSGTQASGTTQ